jgi:Fe-S-cluster-containing dehydrogenase component
MINITDKSQCCGCTACANVCANMGNPDDYVVNIKRDYAEVTDIKDNFTQSMSYEEFMKGVQNNG